MTAIANEYEPLQDMKELLDEKWEDSLAFRRPVFEIVNDPEGAITRIDLTNDDYVLISAGTEQVTYRGNISYIDRVVLMTLNALTKTDRQALYNINKMLRTIFLVNKHAFPNFQLIRVISFREMVGQDLNIWRGEFGLRLENHGIQSDSF
jgi:hypothetical protein